MCEWREVYLLFLTLGMSENSDTFWASARYHKPFVAAIPPTGNIPLGCRV